MTPQQDRTDGAFDHARASKPKLPLPVLRAITRATPGMLSVLPVALRRRLCAVRPVVVDGNTLDPTLQLLLTVLRHGGVLGMVTGNDVALSRTIMRDTCIGWGGARRPVPVRDLAAPGPAGPVRIRRYGAGGPALVYFHGGGYVLGDLDGYDRLCRRISHDAGMQVFSVDYRLAPEHPAPAAVEDCRAAYTWVARQAGGCAVGGDSAGAALAAGLALWARTAEVPAPTLQLLLYPLVEWDAQTRSRTLFADGFVLTSHDLAFFRDRYLGVGVSATDRLSSPLAGDLSGVAPALVVTAGFDPLRDEGAQYAARLARAGADADLRVMPSMVHGFMNFAGLGGGVQACVDDVISAMAARLRRL